MRSDIEQVQEHHTKDIARREGPSDERFDSEKVVVAAPFSYAGSAERIWPYFKRRFVASKERSTEATDAMIAYGWAILGIIVIAMAWIGVTSWYVTFGLMVVPYRMIRRGQRKRHIEALRQRELVEAMNQNNTA